MTTREMNAAEHSQTARDFLGASDREFAAGDHLQGSEKLYGAATPAIIAICQQRGWRYKSHWAMKNTVATMSHVYEDPFIVAGFATAERFNENFFHDNMGNYDLAGEHPAVHRFVARMLALRDGG